MMNFEMDKTYTLDLPNTNGGLKVGDFFRIGNAFFTVTKTYEDNDHKVDGICDNFWDVEKEDYVREWV